MQGQINGNYTNRAIDLTGPAELIECNARVAKVTTNGHPLVVSTKAHHGMTVDGSKDHADWTGVTFTVPEMTDPADTTDFSLIIWGPLPKADEVRKGIRDNLGPEGLAIWSETIDQLFADPAISYPDLVTAVEAWAESDPGGDYAVMNTVNIDRAFRRLKKRYFNDQGYAAIVAYITSFSRETWAGQPTEQIEVIP